MYKDKISRAGVVQTYVSYVRKKLGKYSHLVQSNRGFGYAFIDPTRTESTVSGNATGGDEENSAVFAFGYEDSDTLRNIPEGLNAVRHSLGYAGVVLSQIRDAAPLNPPGSVLWITSEFEGHKKYPENPNFADGKLTLDLNLHNLTIDSKTVELSPLEYGLLELLMSRPNKLFTKIELGEMLWPDRDELPSSNHIETYVSYCRKKLGVYGNFLQTSRGHGYFFSEKINPAQ